MKCDHCENVATVFVTEINHGVRSDRHFCEACAKKQHVAEPPTIFTNHVVSFVRGQKEKK